MRTAHELTVLIMRFAATSMSDEVWVYGRTRSAGARSNTGIALSDSVFGRHRCSSRPGSGMDNLADMAVCGGLSEREQFPGGSTCIESGQGVR